jgi:tRNA (guanine-N7-)-methyltransferase
VNRPDDRIHILTNRWVVVDPRFGRGDDCFVEMDLGCGKGGLALALAQRFPQRLVVACDVMLGRLRKVVNKARFAGLANIEIVRANGFDLLAYQVPPASVHRIHLVCPDPWPKKRHSARRLVNTEFLRRVVRVLAPAGVLHLATDDEEYCEHMLAAVSRIPSLRADASGEAIADVTDIVTEFEKRWNQRGVRVPHFAFVRS